MILLKTCLKKYYHPAPLTRKRSNGILASRDMITLCDMAKYHPSLNELTSTEQWGWVHNKYSAPVQICIPLIVFRSPTKSKSILPSLHLSESPTLCMSILLSLHLGIPYPMKVYSLKCTLVNPLPNASLHFQACTYEFLTQCRPTLSSLHLCMNPLPNASLPKYVLQVNPLPNAHVNLPSSG